MDSGLMALGDFCGNCTDVLCQVALRIRPTSASGDGLQHPLRSRFQPRLTPVTYPDPGFCYNALLKPERSGLPLGSPH